MTESLQQTPRMWISFAVGVLLSATTIMAQNATPANTPQFKPGALDVPRSLPPGTKLRDWHVGTLLDARSTKTYVPTGTTTTVNSSASSFGAGPGLLTGGLYASSTDSQTAIQTRINGVTLKETQMLILGTEYFYVVTYSNLKDEPIGRVLIGAALGATSGKRHRGCPLAVNDPITYARDRDSMIVLDMDGKECRMELERQERILPPSAPVQ
jgi:hypothetical protein